MSYITSEVKESLTHIFPILNCVAINDSFHYKALLKYLFSLPKTHSESSFTKFNLVEIPESDSFGSSYTLHNPKEILEIFNSKEPNLIYNIKELYQMIIYPFFLHEVEGKLYTNILNWDEESQTLYIDIDDKTLNSILENNELSNEEFEGIINNIIFNYEPYEKGNIIFFKDLTEKEELLSIQSLIRFEIMLKYYEVWKKNNDSIKLIISHIDEIDQYFHFHYLIQRNARTTTPN